jgi:WD40 repeat protein/uncharacterized caspase-like protein
LRHFQGHAGPVAWVTFRSNGSQALTGSADNVATLWDVTTGAKLRVFQAAKLPGHSGFSESIASATGEPVAFSSDGRHVLRVSSKSATLWNVVTGARVQAFKEFSGFVTSAAISKDGRKVLIGQTDGTAILWNVATGTQLHAFRGHERSEWIWSVALSPDQKRVLTGSGDNTAILWDAISGAKLRTFRGHRRWVLSVAFSPDQGRVLTGSADATAVLWDAATGANLQSFQGHRYEVLCVAFSPDGRKVLTGSHDKTAVLWDAATGEKLQVLRGHASVVRCAAISPNGRQFLTAFADRPAILWDAITGEKRSLGWNVDCLAFSPDGGQVLTEGYKGVRLWDAATSKELRRFETPSWVESVAFSPDGRHVVAGCWDGTAILWNAATGAKLRTFRGHGIQGDTTLNTSVAFSPDGRQVVTGSHDYTAILWETASGKRLRTFQGHSSVVESVAFSPDGRQLLTGSWDKTTILWDVATGAKLRTFQGHTGEVYSATFSPDGQLVLTGSFDQTAILWRASSGAKLRTFQGHTDRVHSVTFSVDGRQVMTSSFDGTTRLWDAATGDELVRLMSLEDGQDWLAVTAEGLFDGSAGGRERVSFRVGKGLNVVPVDRFFQDFYYPGLLASIWKGERPMPEVALGRSLPPTVKIVSPAEDGTASARRVTIETEVTDQGGGIKGPWIKHNGARVLVDGTSKRTARGVRRTFSISLVEGENRIEIHAASADGSWESEPAVVTLQYAEPLEKPEVYLLAVGINDYRQKDMGLKYARADAQAMAALFQQRGPELYDKVHLHLLENTLATRDKILRAIRGVGRVAREQDTVVLFLAGHGTVVDRRYYFLPQDFQQNGTSMEESVRAEGLSAADIGEALAAVPALKRVLLLDTCQSGGPVAPARTTRNPFALRGVIERLARAEGAFGIVGTATTEKAAEVPELEHGVLTYSLLAGLRAVDKGPLKDQWVQVEGDKPVADILPWFNFASNHVPRLSRQYSGSAAEVQHSLGGMSFAVLPVPRRGAVRPADSANIKTSVVPLTIVGPKEEPGQGAALHMVAIGVNKYHQESMNLKYAAPDAHAMAELFRDRGPKMYGTVSVTEILDAQATKANIQKALDEVSKSARAVDTLIVFLAGHGMMVGQRYYFIPHDFKRETADFSDDVRAQGLAADLLADAVASVPALKRLLILDTCASGGALEMSRQGRDPFAFRGAMEELGHKQGVFTIAASSTSEDAQEIESLGHGALTYALLAGLRAVQSGPLKDKLVRSSRADGTVDVLDWLSFAAGEVPRLTERYLGQTQEIRISGQGMSFPVLPTYD